MNRDNRRKIKGYHLIVISGLLTGCGGGGGGGGGGAQPRPEIRQPPADTGSINVVEKQNSPGLFQVGASQVFLSGGTGQSVTIGVADSGVAAGHEEFSGRVLGGGDWHGTADGLLDEHGHGTHVASLVAAGSDGIGIQGVAPLSRIVSYRILGSTGTFQGRSGNVMVPGLLGDALARDLPVVNHSWSSYYEIDDMSRSRIEDLLRDEITAYRQVATENGPIMVWAAGNGSDNQVSIRSGLPYHLPELEPNWLAVVAVDTEGVEPSYTNRCGIAAAWCLAAPGGGDNQGDNGILGADHEGGYTRKSGTSMAAPVVSAAIGLLIDQIPGLTPRMAVARLKVTATYDGLTTAAGCTLDSCGEAAMRSVFGHGLIQIDEAIQPISPNAVLLGNGERADLAGSGLTLPSMMAMPLLDRLDGIAAVIEDDFDGTLYQFPLGALAAGAEPAPFDQPSPVVAVMQELPEGQRFLIAGAGQVPGQTAEDRRMLDIPAMPLDRWAGYAFTSSGEITRYLVGLGNERQAIHLLKEWQGEEAKWISLGFDRSARWLDGGGYGALKLGGHRSGWVAMGREKNLGPVTATAEVLAGYTRLEGASPSLIHGGGIWYDSWRIGVTHTTPGQQRWRLDLSQPPALRDGKLTLMAPVTGSGKAAVFHPVELDLSLRSRERRLMAGLDMPLAGQDSMKLTAAVTYIQNRSHQPGAEDGEFRLTLDIDF
ncbi:S8 family peptidase [Alphaproteobacteria bacterium LSUCC0684]